MSAEAARRADDVLRVTMRRADRIITATDAAGDRAARTLMADLREADRRLRAKLAKFAGSEERFTARSLLSYQRQIALVTRQAQKGLARLLRAAQASAKGKGYRETAVLLRDLEQAFTGIARPVRLAQAAMLNPQLRADSSLLATRATSVDRYGRAMIGEFERRMRVGLITGASQRDMVNELCGHGGPTGEVSVSAREVAPGVVERLRTEHIEEGLFTRYRSWAWRIVRTETARAYTAARMEGLFEQRQEMPALTKKILATFDPRTAMDSVLVHGQVRRLEEPFVDGAGRVYLQPPARPNDRETVIPWLPDWTETPITSPLTPEQVEAARARANRGLDPEHQRARLAASRATSAAQRAAPAEGVPARQPRPLPSEPSSRRGRPT